VLSKSNARSAKSWAHMEVTDGGASPMPRKTPCPRRGGARPPCTRARSCTGVGARGLDGAAPPEGRAACPGRRRVEGAAVRDPRAGVQGHAGGTDVARGPRAQPSREAIGVDGTGRVGLGSPRSSRAHVVIVLKGQSS